MTTRAFLLASVLLSACVIPVAPDFQNPPAAQNFPPQLLGENPAFLSETMSATFRVTVTDPNGGDDLFIRWYTDWRPITPLTRTVFAPVTTVLHRADGVPQFTLLETTVDCVRDFIPRGISRHQVVVMAGDQDFVPESTDLTLLKDGSHATVGGWVLDKQCPGEP